MLSLTLERQSWAHRIPVGWKLAALCGLTFFVFPLENIALLTLGIGGVGLLCASLGRVGFTASLRGLRPILWFAVIILGYHLLVGRIGQGLGIVLRMLLLVGAANFVTMTSRLSDMMNWVIWALSPLRRLGIPPERIALAFALMIRFTPVLGQRAAHLAQAWRARSNRRVGVGIVAPLAVSALDDADHVAEALRARGGVR
ncbi:MULTISPECIES: energy-coupling factor transporter transmembrane component T [Rhodobacterales]|uniref:energy-coupling factor transporter transmembrane component T family protein n=1 Tax=Roseobacter sp. N2S TaxID=2663844 RepID=UPI002867349D|nr:MULTISPECIES: energy-coupling factor transporter transmembrane component T [Rhodobacterales]MDR6264148.1 biotin transport system permease protein [Roseobacter sp. N2S]